MKLYAILGRYYGTQAEAKAAAKEGDVKFDAEQDTVEVPTDKEGLIGYLNRLSSAIERDPIDEFETVVERHDPPVEVIRDNPLQFDDAWEQFPLAKKLHFAALACEDAREAIKPKAAPAMPIAKIDAIDDELFG